MNRLRITLTVGIVALATACAGPTTPLSLQTQALPLNVILGRHAAVVTAPLAPITLPVTPTGPGVFAPPSPTTATIAVKKTSVKSPIINLGPCPAFDPLAPIGLLPNLVTKAPKPATYTYRSTFAMQTGSTKTTYKGATRWTVSKPSAPDPLGDYTYTIKSAVPAAGFSKTTTYEVIPTGIQAEGQQIPPNAGTGNTNEGLPTDNTYVASPEYPGIYLSAVRDSTGMSFLPSTPLPLVQFPIQPNSSFTTAGVDGKSVLTYTSTVTRQTKVNACGTPVGVWEVKMTNGLVTTPGQPPVHFTETLDFSTASGGLVVGDSYDSSTIASTPGAATLQETDIINTTPKDAS